MNAEPYADPNTAATQRAGRVVNLVRKVAPVSSANSALRSVGSAAAALARGDISATAEQASLAGAGISATACALGGAIATVTNRPSGIVDDGASATRAQRRQTRRYR